MTDILASTTDRTSDRQHRRRDEKLKQRQAEMAELEERRSRLELNPYWKNGGTGLPPTESDGSRGSTGPPSSSQGGRNIAGNDGGVSWWRKALQRCQELAETEGRPLEEIAAERYGVSLNFTLLLSIIVLACDGSLHCLYV